MKMRTALQARAGSKPMIVLTEERKDYEAIAVAGVVDIWQLAHACREAVMAGRSRGPETTVEVDGCEARVQTGVARALALAKDGDPRYDGLHALLTMPKSGGYQGTRAVIARPDDAVPTEDVWAAVPLSELPCPVLPIWEFAEACRAAVEEGRVKVSKSLNGGTKRDREYYASRATRRLTAKSHLCDMLLTVTARGVTHDIRLDLAMALVKRVGKLPLDVMLGAQAPGLAQGLAPESA